MLTLWRGTDYKPRIMIKEIKTEKFEGLAVLVPDDYAGSMANMGYLVVMVTNPATLIHEKHFNSPYAIRKQLDRVSKLPDFVSLPAIKLPDGDYKILGKATDMTEEQCAEIVEVKKAGLFIDYMTEKPKYHLRYYDSAKESFASLMQVNECYRKNPFEAVFTNNTVFGNRIAECSKDAYITADRSTGTWLILQKL